MPDNIQHFTPFRPEENLLYQDKMDIYTVTTKEILERISRHCPEALSVYLQCINRCDRNGCIHFTKDMVEVECLGGARCIVPTYTKVVCIDFRKSGIRDRNIRDTIFEESKLVYSSARDRVAQTETIPGSCT